jgi:demethylmenaquinone methyltransferase/2-methoxy-6-polyprenyl-1,4-benzoquinol methylase
MNLSNSADRDPESVREMFRRIAGRYDLTNHLLSLGLDFFWRKRASEIVGQWKPARVLDVATGSGDLALTIEKKLPDAEIVGTDFCPEMLEIARSKGLTKTLVADALHLPFPDMSFDVVTVAFGLRNMANWGAALREMARVLTPGGHVLVLEFSLPRGLFRAPYRAYLHHFLPRVAGFVTRQKGAYQYLGESIEHFPSGDMMCVLIENNGFGEATSELLSGGIVSIYSAAKGTPA